MKKCLISVIIPVYNAENYIENACESVFKQTYSEWELVIVDDGSTDSTLEIISRIADEHTRVRVLHTENRGVCQARNSGIDMAIGEYITFLDADDELETDFLEKLYANLLNNNCDIAIGQKIVEKSDGTEVLFEYALKGEYEIWDNDQALLNSLKDHPATYSVWGKVYKKEFIKGIRFVSGRKIHEDSYFLFECFLKEPRVIVTDDRVYRYHVSENSASRAQFSDKFLDILYFAERKKEKVEKLYPKYTDMANNVMVKANMALLMNLCKTYNRKYRQIEKQCIKTVIRNKKIFVPATKANKQWFFIIEHHLYFMYKLMFWIARKCKTIINR